MEAHRNSVDAQEKQEQQIIRILESFQDIDMVMENPVLKEEIEHLLNRIQDDYFRVAVVGEFSSGKSTFINALIQKDVLKHGAQETTATLTRIINVQAADKNIGKCKVNFINGDVKSIDNLDQITSYTTTHSKSHDVSHDISSFDIYMHFLDMEKPIMVIDTPGLNGLADNHREQTIQQLKDTHACIYMLQLRGLTQSDIEFIRFISNYQHDFIFVQNFIDELKALEDETLESKLLKQRNILKNIVFFDKPDIRFELCGISSRKALIARDRSFVSEHEFSDEPLNEIQRKKLLHDSNFDAVIQNLNRLMVSNYKGKVQQRSVVESLLHLIEYLKSITSIKQDELSALWEGSDEAQVQRKSLMIREKLLENQESHIKKLGNFVDSKVEELNRFIGEKIQNDLKTLEFKLVRIINSLSTIESVEKYVDEHQVEYALRKEIPEIEQSYLKLLEEGFQDIMNNSILRVQEYIGECTKVKETPVFEVKKTTVEFKEFTQDESNLNILREEIIDLVTHQKSASMAKQRLKAEEQEAQARLSQNQQELAEIERSFHVKMEELGEEPIVEIVECSESKDRTRKERYPFLGGLMDFFMVGKPGTVQVKKMETPKKDHWNAERIRHLNHYTEQLGSLQINDDRLRASIEECEVKINRIEKSEFAKNIQLRNMEAQLWAMKEALDTKRTVARIEYMNLIKRMLAKRIQGYLFEDENIMESYVDNVTQHIHLNRETLRTKIIDFYEAVFLERIKRFTDTINSQKNLNEAEFVDTMETIEKIRLELEECLCQIL